MFRYGVAVLFGLSPVEEDEVLRGLRPRILAPFDRYEDETATIEVVPEGEEQIAPGGPIVVRDLSPPRLLVIADALAKNLALARDEREVSKVFETIEPFAVELARDGRLPTKRRQIVRTIGQALLTQHRVSGASRLKRSRMSSGTIRSSSASMRGLPTNTRSRNARRRSHASSGSSAKRRTRDRPHRYRALASPRGDDRGADRR